MAVGYRVKTIRCESGERLPLLVSKATGVPLWNPTLFILTELRAKSRAVNTLAQATRALMVAHQVFRYLRIDLDERLLAGQLLTLGEIEVLVKLAGLRQEALDSLPENDTSARPVVPRIVPLGKARMRSSAGVQPQVELETKAARLIYIRDYLAWLAAGRRLELKLGHEHLRALNETAQTVVERLNARIPGGGDKFGGRQGVSAEVRARILEVTDPDSPENPWKNKHVRFRNRLIFLWLLLLGVRNGELLGIYANDVNLRSGEVAVIRRPDNPDELRKNVPLVKTSSRLLALGPELVELTRVYLTAKDPRSKSSRANFKDARRHPYLFVATGTGAPLSKSALNKLFRELRTKVPGLPDDLSPHVLRHTWNDDFSDLMDARGVSPEAEEKMRRQTMGWSSRSQMASRYTKRHAQRKSDEASLAMQAEAFQPDRKGTR